MPKALQRICGDIQIPLDGGKQLIEYLSEQQLSLARMSDASLKDNTCTHTWILSTGKPDHITDPLRSIQGRGTVDGAPTAISLVRGELQGQTAMAIISQLLLQEHQQASLPTILHSDNEGVPHTCTQHTLSKLQHHRTPNTDLLAEFRAATANRQFKSVWVKGQQNTNPG